MSMPAARRASNPEQIERAERDLALIEAYRSGRGDAFETLVRSYDGHVRRLLLQLNVPGADVEDLVQDVFLRIFRNLPRFRGQSSFYTWLYRITVNVFFDHNKRRKRADARLARLQTAVGDASYAPHDTGDPYRATSDALAIEAFAAAIATLPAAFRDVIAMREVDDLSYEEIAVQTGISIGTVRSRLSRARQRLKEILRPAFVDAAA